MTPVGVEFTLNYFHQRWSGDDGTNYAPLRGIPRSGNLARDTARFQRILRRGVFPAEAIMPYVHTIGVSANYADDRYTQSFLRLETVYDVGIPFFDAGRVTLVGNPALPGVTKKDMWKGMIGVDRPTWIRALNRRSTVFLTGQFSWHHLLDNPECRAQGQTQLSPDARERAGSCLVGGLDLPSTTRPASVAFRDKIRDWETIFSLAAFTFYRGGRVLPSVALVADPVNQWSMAAIWSVDWVVTEYLALNLAQRWFVTPKAHSTPIFETWGLAGMNGGRSETSLRVTVQYRVRTRPVDTAAAPERRAPRSPWCLRHLVDTVSAYVVHGVPAPPSAHRVFRVPRVPPGARARGDLRRERSGHDQRRESRRRRVRGRPRELHARGSEGRSERVPGARYDRSAGRHLGEHQRSRVSRGRDDSRGRCRHDRLRRPGRVQRLLFRRRRHGGRGRSHHPGLPSRNWLRGKPDGP